MAYGIRYNLEAFYFREAKRCLKKAQELQHDLNLLDESAGGNIYEYVLNIIADRLFNTAMSISFLAFSIEGWIHFVRRTIEDDTFWPQPEMNGTNPKEKFFGMTM